MATSPRSRWFCFGLTELLVSMAFLAIPFAIGRADNRDSALFTFTFFSSSLFGVSLFVGTILGNWRAGMVVGLVFGLATGGFLSLFDLLR
jgi:hypothetical protein